MHSVIVKRCLVVLGLALAPLLGILLFQAGLRAEGNFHEVLPGQFYRAAQLSAGSLDRHTKQYRIKTILNLRGAQPDAEWYREERKIAGANGVKLVDFAMSADKDLTRERALELVQIMKDAPKPILVHCKTGADRTGLVSIIYAYKIAGMDEEAAEEQLAAGFGHFGIPFLSPTYAMDESWEDLEQLFGIEGS